ncbi:MAG TPA: type IV pilus secretin PilQ, partial [Thermoanaerobaculia bacterium]|nr:type IV pilus secretin PilQ [Thermoanaerobaculia bacterium]
PPVIAAEPVSNGGNAQAGKVSEESGKATTAPPIPAKQAATVPKAAQGTPDHPLQGPPVAGPAATQLARVEVQQHDGELRVQIVGDGEFKYSTFRLSDPDRFVVDLAGAVDNSPRGSIEVAGGAVKRVRMAQFKARPKPVARVVFDLAAAVAPQITNTANGLTVVFGAATEEEASGEQAPTLAQEVARKPEAQAKTKTAEETPAGVEQETPATTSPVSATTSAEPQSAKAEPAASGSAAVTAKKEAGEVAAPSTQARAATPASSSPPKSSTAPPSAAKQEKEAAAASAPTQAEEMPPAATPQSKAASAAPTSDVALFEASDVKMPQQPEQQGGAEAKTFSSKTVASGTSKYHGEPISMSLKDADIKNVLRSFAKISHLNIVVQPDVSGTVTVELTDVPWDQALQEILKINGLGYELDGNIMRIAKTGDLQREAEERQKLAAAQASSIPLQTVIKRLSYADAQQVASLLRQGGGASLLSRRGTVLVDKRTNTLIIKELPNFMNTVLAVIENLDTPEPQVRIEAKIVETTKQYSRSLGVRWNFNALADSAHGNTTGLVFPNNVNASGGVELLQGANNGFLDIAMGNILNTFQLNAALNAAESQGLVNILSAPSVAVLNNDQASIQSGLQIPIQTVANNTVTVQYVNATLQLRVTPHVTAQGTVLMDINVQKREPQLAFAVSGANNAPIDTKEARTRVIVRDGGTTVIGGIYKVTTNSGEDRVPGLANIPIIGHLFRSHRRSDQNEELLIFITPRVIKL